MTRDVFRSVREKQGELGDELIRQRGTDDVLAPPAFVGQVFSNPSVPTQTGVFFSVHPVAVSGHEGESNPGTLSVDTSTVVPVYVVGSKPPLVGDNLVCRFIGNRWVADRMTSHTGGLVSIPGCPCTATPTVLHMTSTKPQSNFGIFQSATLVYSPTPPPFATLTSGPFCYLSPGSFTDQVTGDSFQYHLDCLQGYYIITRLYLKSVYGSPFRDIIRYKWLIGLPGNNCAPFLLSRGQVYAGGDPTCIVTITP